jgi:hypothetical protein
MTAKQDYAEKRQFGRRKTYLHGWVKIPGRPLAACTIHNMSDGGALLEFMRAEPLPFSFILTIEGTNQTYGCEVRHTAGLRTGVGFVDIATVQQASRAGYGGEVGTWVEQGSVMTRK